jgi:NADH:ubiquinone oxidoreductase subunit K
MKTFKSIIISWVSLYFFLLSIGVSAVLASNRSTQIAGDMLLAITLIAYGLAWFTIGLSTVISNIKFKHK